MGTWIKEHSYWNSKALKIFVLGCWIKNTLLPIDVNIHKSLRCCVGGEASSWVSISAPLLIFSHQCGQEVWSGGSKHGTESQDFQTLWCAWCACGVCLWCVCVFSSLYLKLYILIRGPLDFSFMTKINSKPSQKLFLGEAYRRHGQTWIIPMQQQREEQGGQLK